MNSRVCHKFLVHWRERPPSNDLWITTDKLHQLDPHMWARYIDKHPTQLLESSSSNSGGVDVGQDPNSNVMTPTSELEADQYEEVGL